MNDPSESGGEKEEEMRYLTDTDGTGRRDLQCDGAGTNNSATLADTSPPSEAPDA